MVKLTSSSSPRLFLRLLLLALLLTNGSAGNGSLSDGPDITKCDDSNGTYTSASTYQQNLNTLFSQMTTSDMSFGFYNSSFGQAPDVIYLISLCLGNFPVTDCRACLSGIVEQIDMLCPTQKNAVLWAGKCMLRYSKYPMIGKMEESPPGALGKGTYFPNVTDYIQVVHKLLRSLPSRAAAGNSSIKFAYAQAEYNSQVTIYSAAQCTPDLTHQDCVQCLDDAVVGTKSVSLGERGARYNFPSCYVRYEEYMFYWLPGAPPPAFSPPASSPASSTKGIGGTIYRTRSSKRTRKIILAAAVAGSLCVLLIASFIYICIRKRELYQNLLHINKFIDGDDISKSLQFKFSTTRAATGNFSEDNKLGQGGFGAVYKGRLPDSGQEIAVKRLAGNSSQGEAEFKNEIKLLAKLQHKNLVRLLGFCFHNKERLLIYEFVPNASLDHFLFDATRRAHLDWETRYNIIRGIARGILYLQEDSRLRIVHRDLKASNILLDAEMCPKIADFGTARLFDIHQTHSETRRIVGTYGYMAPEYALHGNFSTKSDVYSFGILLLEIVCGKRCSDIVLDGEISRNLISLVWRKWNEGTPLDIVDSAITNGIELEIIRCINIGLLCVQDNVVDRPTVSSVLQMMSNEDLALPLPLQPASIILSNMRLDSEHVNSNSIERSIELESITELLAR